MAKEPPELDYGQSLTRAVVETAQSVVAGTLGPVEAARSFMGMAAELDALEDPDFAFFVDLDSASDQFPLGEARAAWSPKALEREDRALQAYEALIRDEALVHCRALIAKYSQS